MVKYQPLEKDKVAPNTWQSQPLRLIYPVVLRCLLYQTVVFQRLQATQDAVHNPGFCL